MWALLIDMLIRNRSTSSKVLHVAQVLNFTRTQQFLKFGVFLL